MSRLTFLLALVPLSAGAQERGEALFATHCASCHALVREAPAGPGPNLHALLGRAVAGDPGYDYSPALQQARAATPPWTRDRLARFLADPEEMFPGTWMGNRLRRPAEIAAVVAFLADQGTASSSP